MVFYSRNYFFNVQLFSYYFYLAFTTLELLFGSQLCGFYSRWNILTISRFHNIIYAAVPRELLEDEAAVR